MRNAAIVGLLVVSSLLLNGCGQQGSSNASLEGQSGSSTSSSAPAKIPVTLTNAYTAKTLERNGDAGAPTHLFMSSDKIYVGVVLHGEANSASVKIDWSLASGPVLGSEEVAIPVVKAAVATLDLTKNEQLKAGEYKVLVVLNGKPSWELRFNVD